MQRLIRIFWLKGLTLSLGGCLLGGMGHCIAQGSAPSPKNAFLGNRPTPSCTPYPALTFEGSRTLADSMVTTGRVSLIYIRVRFPDEPPEPVALEDASNDLKEVTRLLESISYGRCHLEWIITQVFTLPKSREAYSAGDSFNDLLNDARLAAKAGGVDYTEYQLDVVRHTGVATLASGSANLGRRGIQLAISGSFFLLHEIGHNFGLNHANFWDTRGPEGPGGSPPLPSDYKLLHELDSISIHLNSTLGQPNLTGPGQSMEYGDPWDVMGSGPDQFSIPNRLKLGWVDEAAVDRVLQTSTNRIYAPDVQQPVTGQTYGLRIPSRDRELWVEIAAKSELHPDAGLILRWANPEASAGTDLLQPGVGFEIDRFDRTLLVGKTFSDRFRDLHLTPIAAGGSGTDRWMDVVTYIGSSLGNRPPVVVLTADRAAANPGEPVVMTATAVDPDGDVLSWRWDFDDSTAAVTANRAEKSWSSAGEYVVQVEVSDRKGGVGRAHLLIRVGEPTTARLAGRVTDDSGNPISGARVHTLAVEGKNQTLRWMLTDSDGRYLLTKLGAGIYTNGAFAFGYRMDHVPALQVTGPEIAIRDYRARALPRVEISSPRFIREGAGLVNVFTLTRTGPTDDPLSVPFRISGTAQPGTHYEEPLLKPLFIPSGARTATLALNLLDVPGVESWKTIELNLEIPVESEHRRGDGSLYTRFYPGLDIERIDGQPFWTLTDPLFVPGASATVILVDDDLRLEIREDDASTITLTLRGDPGTFVDVEASPDLVEWTFVSTHQFPRNGLSELKLPKPPATQQFFRLHFATNE